MAVRMLLSGVCAVLSFGLLGPATASATETCSETASCIRPSCANAAVEARPGHLRAYEVYCSHTDTVELVDAPEHGELSGLALNDLLRLRWSYRPDEDAPANDAFTVRITGPGGTRDLVVPIEVIPLSVNTAPYCYGPGTIEQRSPGTGPVDVFFHVSCWDEENDEVTIEGSGPGAHLYSPRTTPWRDGHWPWVYRTATAEGTEETTIWATDVLGARSEDAKISVTVGPGIDRKPRCWPNGGTGWGGEYEVSTRAGAIRRFSIICEDDDGDAIESIRVSDQPEHGLMALLLDPLRGSPNFRERWAHATYTPAVSAEDPFAVVAGGARGDAPEVRMKMVPNPDSVNTGGGCGWSPSRTFGGPVALSVSCSDGDGDAFQAKVVEQPKHGTVLPPVVTPGEWDWQDITAAYTPEPGFTGLDCVVIEIDDGHGMTFRIPIDISVEKPGTGPAPPPIDVPPVDPPEVKIPPVGGSPGGSSGGEADAREPVVLPRGAQLTATSVAGTTIIRPAAEVEEAAATPPVVAQLAAVDQARKALATSSVRLVRTIGGTRVFSGRGRLAVTCAVDCSVAARPLGGRARASRLRRIVATPGRAELLPLPRGTDRVRLSIADARGRRDRVTLRLR